MRFALVGNPNTGKTSLFNLLTDTYAAVGNWSGVTVEKKVGRMRAIGAELVDLPGMYSLLPLSRDEAVAVRFLFAESYAGVINIVDASQLRRNLQLTLQLLELGVPVVVALNMIDVAGARGMAIDAEALSRVLGVPVVPIVARTGHGKASLVEALGTMATDRHDVRLRPSIDYGEAIEATAANIAKFFPDPMKARFWALRYLEGHPAIAEPLEREHPEARTLREALEGALRARGATSIAAETTRRRYAWIDQTLPEIERLKNDTTRGKPLRRVSQTWTERLDRWATHPVLGMPIFFFVMYVVFQLTFDRLGTPLSDRFDAFFAGPLSAAASSLLTAIGAAPFYRDLVVEGIIAGVGGVLVFVPQIFILFFFISLLEDSGYMARVAIVVDRLMERFGLNGKAFIPLIVGFGCNVPGVMAARTIESPRERLVTALITPFMSCSARLAVYALFVGTFFRERQALVIFSLYVLGIALALVSAFVLTRTLARTEASMFWVELPPYRLPHARTLWRSTWEKGKGFVRKAGTFILGGSVAIWLLSYAGPGGLDVPIEDSFLAWLGGALAPLFAPLGFGFWQAGVALLTGFLAKEVVISTLGIAFYTGDSAALSGALATVFTPLSAYAFLVFLLLYMPCLATVAALHRETGSRKWTGFSIGYSLMLAYAAAFVVYHVGRWAGLH